MGEVSGRNECEKCEGFADCDSCEGLAGGLTALLKEPREALRDALDEGLEREDGERTTSRRFKVLLLGPSNDVLAGGAFSADLFQSATDALEEHLALPLLVGLADAGGMVSVVHV